MKPTNLMITLAVIFIGIWCWCLYSQPLEPLALAVGGFFCAFGGMMFGVGLGRIDMERFLKDMKSNPPKPNTTIRMPLHARPISYEEFREMWGDDPMPQ